MANVLQNGNSVDLKVEELDSKIVDDPEPVVEKMPLTAKDHSVDQD